MKKRRKEGLTERKGVGGGGRGRVGSECVRGEGVCVSVCEERWTG